MSKFKGSNVIYFKTSGSQDLLSSSAFRGKIIVSDFPELNRVCTLYGLIHVLNTKTQKIPEGVDLIIANARSPDLESRIMRYGLGVPILYTNMKQKWCGICGKLGSDEKINKYCSPECMQKATGFSSSRVPEPIKDLGANQIFNRSTVISFDKSISNRRVSSNKMSNTREESLRKSREKFQKSMVKDAKRLEYAFKKVEYTKEMRQPSHRKSRITSKKSSERGMETKKCQSTTKNGEQCQNNALDGSNFCGISSHC